MIVLFALAPSLIRSLPDRRNREISATSDTSASSVAVCSAAATVAVETCYFQTCLHDSAAIVGGHGFAVAASSWVDGVRRVTTVAAAVAASSPC